MCILCWMYLILLCHIIPSFISADIAVTNRIRNRYLMIHLLSTSNQDKMFDIFEWGSVPHFSCTFVFTIYHSLTFLFIYFNTIFSWTFITCISNLCKSLLINFTFDDTFLSNLFFTNFVQLGFVIKIIAIVCPWF